MSEQQTTDTVVMVSPDSFEFNQETAASNTFQLIKSNGDMKQNALREFSSMAALLKSKNIRVITLKSVPLEFTPDAVFPNNWFTTHSTGSGCLLILYPMMTKNRRAERQQENLVFSLAKNNIDTAKLIDLSHHEEENKFLEGTGSVILDRVNKLAYASLSPRTNKDVLDEFAKLMNYKVISFHSTDQQGVPIYHTNVMMSVGTNFVVVVGESIRDQQELNKVVESIQKTGKTLINISLEQMQQMAANILEVKTLEGDAKIIMSKRAFDSFKPEQRAMLASYGELIVVQINTIEDVGGGSARCMLAEIFY